MKRRKMKKRHSRKNFRKGTMIHKKNDRGTVMRGGYRL